MEDQGKRILIAVGIAFALMLGWQFLFPQEKPKPKPKPDDRAQPQPTPGVDAPPAPRADAPADAPVVRGEEQRATFSFPKFTATTSSYGGALVSWTLAGKKFEDRTQTDKPPLELAPTGVDEATRPFDVWFVDSTYGIPRGAEWTPSNASETGIDYTWASDAIRVVKKLRFEPDHYLLRITIELQKLAPGDAKQALAVSTYTYQDPSASTGGGMGGQIARLWEAACYVEGAAVRYASLKELGGGERGSAGDVKWLGFSHPYFLAALAPRNDTKERLGCSAVVSKDKDGVMETTLFYPQIAIADGDPSYTRELTAFFGPKYMDQLDAISGAAGYDTGFDDAVDLGWLAFICRPMLWLMDAFEGVIGNWGIAIILLTIVVQAITLPWTTKSMRSMKQMAKLRPQMEKLKEKYPDDKQRQQVEMMNLYKAHNVNPLAGCLPMLLQMPIWFALYRSLRVAGELYQAPFIPGWLDDLTAPDPYYVMPVLLLGMMFVQTKLQPNPVESMQQKIMMYGMPLMFGFFSLFFPSGLTLYILTNTILRSAHQVYLNRTDTPDKPAPAAAPAAEGGSGAGAAPAKKRRKTSGRANA
jgi:YidC/Oxa1 family membrane protein insertase